MSRLVRASSIVATLAFAAFFAACGGESTTGPKVDDLTTEQRAAIATAYSTTTITGIYASVATLQSLNQTITGKDTTACTGGGQLRSSYTALASGTAANEQNSATADFTYDGCVLQSASHQYTIGGTLNTHVTMVTTTSSNIVTGWTIKGTLTANGQSCAFDVALADSKLTGTFCGVAASSLTGIDFTGV